MLDVDHTHDTLDATASFVAAQNLVVEHALVTRPPGRTHAA